MLWYILLFLVALKIPLVYLCYVVWWAVKDPPQPGDGVEVLAGARRWRARRGRVVVAAQAGPAATWRTARLACQRTLSLRSPMRDEAAGMSTPEHAELLDARPPARETIARYLAGLAIFGGLTALVYYPVRIGLAGIVFAMVAAAMGGQRCSRFTGIAVVIAVAGFTWASPSRSYSTVRCSSTPRSGATSAALL